MNKTIITSILCMMLVQFFVLISIDSRISRIEKKVDKYFEPVEDIPLPEWEQK